MHIELANPSGLCMCGCGQKTPIATQSVKAHGQVIGQPKRYVPYHGPHTKPGPKWEVDQTTGCWNWLRARSTDGHRGIVGIHNPETRKTQIKRAYRFVYEGTVGPIPEGLELDHTCHNPLCVNPAHLEPVTHEENVRRQKAYMESIGKKMGRPRKVA